MIYLDHAATTPLPRPVADAMYQVLTEEFGMERVYLTQFNAAALEKRLKRG